MCPCCACLRALVPTQLLSPWRCAAHPNFPTPPPVSCQTKPNLLRPEAAADGKAHTCDDHDDSVYGLAWSAADPWLFASLSYDGRVLVNRVPKSVKYKVLI